MTSRYTVSGKIQQRDWLLKSQVSGKTMSPTCELTFAVTPESCTHECAAAFKTASQGCEQLDWPGLLTAWTCFPWNSSAST